MAYFDTPMTKLDAVNVCLSSMGEPTVSQISGEVLDAQLASDLIDETSRSVQAKGWHWNLETRKLAPNTSGEIVLPLNTARVDAVKTSKDLDVVQRGRRLFNRGDNSYNTFTDPVEVDLYVLLSWEDLPLSAKNFITIRSARLLQQRLLGSDTLFKFSQADEQQAYLILMQEESEVGDFNTLWDNESTRLILTRGYFARGQY